MKKIVLIVAVVVLAVIGAFAAARLFSKPQVKVLESAKVQRGDLRGVLVETGIVKPQVGALVKIGTRATGTIVKMNVKIGDRVEKGQLVALIDDREIRRAIEQQQAALAAAQETLRQAELTYPERIKEAKANYEYAKTVHERERELIKYDYTTRDELDKARSQFEGTRAILKRLQDEYSTQIKIAGSNIEEHAAQLQQQEVRLTYTRIYSPVAGVVSDVTAQEGETIVAGLQVANLITVLDPTLLEMWIYVDETDIGKVGLGQRVEYYVDTFPGRLFSGAIEKIHPQPMVKDNIVYYLAIVKVPGADAAFLKPEMTTHVRIVFSESNNVLVVPNAAIKFEGGKQVVYRLTGSNQVQKAGVTIGTRGEDHTEILSGVGEGDEVAVKLILPIADKP